MSGNQILSRRVMLRLPKLALLIIVGILLSVDVYSADLQVGFGDFAVDPGRVPPTAAALFRLTNPEGILVSEAGVGAAQLLEQGRIFVQQSSSWNTGLALANPLDRKTSFRLILRNSQGIEIARIDRFELEPREHQARFVSELFTGLPQDFVGSLTFQGLTVEDRMAAVTLRQTANRYGEPLYSTLPVAEIGGENASGDQSLLVFPQVGAGQGLSTQLVLISRAQTISRGTVRLINSDGDPLIVRSTMGTAAQFPFELPAQGVFFAEFTNPPGVDLAVGYAKVEVTDGLAPAGTAIFRFTDGDKSISEAGVGAMPLLKKARIFVDSNQTSTGFAVANPGNSIVSITYRLLDLNGVQIQQVNRLLSARHHYAKFAHEIFDLPAGFLGLIEMESSQPFVPISLKLTSNSRHESILTTLPVADLLTPLQATRLVFPQMGFGASSAGPFSTRLIFVASQPNTVTAGNLSFWTGEGQPWSCRAIPSQLRFAVAPGGAAHLRFESEPAPLVIERGNRTKALIGPAGGTLKVENERGDTIALEIPPRALAQSQYITMTALDSPPADTFAHYVFPGVVLEPDGLVLREPARLQVLLKNPLTRPEMSALMWFGTSECVWAIGNEPSASQLMGGEIYHFSEYAGPQLTLSEATAWVYTLQGYPDRLKKLGLDTLDPALRQFMVTFYDVNSVLRGAKMYDVFLDDNTFLNTAEGMLREGITAFLAAPVPSDACGLYHSYLGQLANSAALLLGNDPAVTDPLFERVDEVDAQCAFSIAGNWRITSIEPEEQCQAPVLEWTEETSDEGSSVNVTISQSGSALSATSPEYPESGTLKGRLHSTGNEAVPYYFDLSIEGAQSPDCLAFFAGEDDDFSYPPCAGSFPCTPVSCYETYVATGDISWDGLTLSGMALWTFTATVRLYDPEKGPFNATYSCLGGAGLIGNKQMQCDDHNDCTSDSYVAGQGCVHKPLTGSFDFNPYDCYKTECQSGIAVSLADDSEKPPQRSPNDCQKQVCRFGDSKTVEDLSETAPYEPHNCRQEVCSAFGVQYKVDDTDLPVQDSPYDCVKQVCKMGEPTSVPDDSETPPPAADGTPRICRNGEAVPAP
jgi:hypothetical protein